MSLFKFDYIQTNDSEVVLTPLLPSHYEGLSEIAAPDKEHLNAYDSFWENFNSVDSITKHMERSARSEAEWLMILGRGVLVGAIYGQRLHFPTPTAGIGYWVASAFKGRGLAAIAATLVSEHILTHHYADVVVASPRIDNTASVRTLERAGFTPGRVFENRLSGKQQQLFEKYRFLLPNQS